MADSKVQDEKSIFLKAIEIESEGERAEYLDAACGGNPQLRAEIEALLRAHDQSGDLLDAPDAALPTEAPQSITETSGTIIGRYKLLQQIGEGGFGVVFMAEQQEPIQRRVALKIIKPGMDTKEVIARFEAEEQALAMMDHPNIAKVLDAGATESGRPYFVMELVRGIPITDYCDQNNLAPAERLESFVSVCQAVQHAHQKGIIHRDIKPTNVLVTLHDGKPVVKVIDFGVAKAINQRLTERTLFTKFAQMVGTPMYMSPEQAEMSGLDVDTRTDIYSLGVVLYELLTGCTPFDKQRLHKAAYDELRRIIREEEPPRPSVKISTLGTTATALSAHRKMEPNKLSALMRGELDWIVMKALEKDRSRRYETPKDLAGDVRRYLTDQPVEARGPSVIYRLRKLVRRYRVAVATVAAVAATLVATTVFIAWTAIRERDAHHKALASMEISLCALVAAEDFSTAETVGRELFATYQARFGKQDVRTSGVAVQLAKSLAGLRRSEEAIALVEDVFAAQTALLGDRSTVTRETGQALAELCAATAWDLALPSNAKRADYDRAVNLARRCVELETEVPHQWTTLALAHYRSGDLQTALDALRTAGEQDDSWGERVWWLLALLHWKIGNQELARDCYTVCNYRTNDADFLRLRVEVTNLLQADELWNSGNATTPRIVEACSNLLRVYPRAYWLYQSRSSCHASLGDWEDAALDLGKALEFRPNPDYIYYEGWIAFLLAAGDDRNAGAVCRQASDKFRSQTGASKQLRLVMLCCLVPSAGIDLKQLAEVVSAAESNSGKETAIAVSRRMIAYRSGRFNDAANLPPEYDFGEDVTAAAVLTASDPFAMARWKEHVLSLVFRAMAHHQLGETNMATQLLSEARRRTPAQFPVGLPSSAVSSRYRAAQWCMAHAGVQEAETLIEPSEKRSEGAADTDSDG